MTAGRYAGIRQWLVPAMLLALGGMAQAQQNPPTIGYVYPAGGKTGTTFEVTVGGQSLREVRDVVVSGKGVQAVVLEHIGPVPQRQLEQLRETLKELNQRKRAARGGLRRLLSSGDAPATRPAWTAEDDGRIERIQDMLQSFARGRAVPALADMVRLKVTISPDAPIGQRTLRLRAASGLTNPMVFCVGRLPEFSEKVATGAQRFGISEEGRPRRLVAPAEASQSPMSITLPATVNGQILAGERRDYRFMARKGQRIVVAVQARQLLPYLADAVPGWFQAMVTVYDPGGAQIACADHFRFDPDPVLSCIIPADGQYGVRIHDALSRGREDFVYRMTIGPLPHVTEVFPLGMRAGTTAIVQLTGWNLPRTAVPVNGGDRRPGTFSLGDGRDPLLDNIPFAVDDLPECLERQPDSPSADPQLVSLPVIINGRIERPGVSDVFCFQGRAGQTVVAEVMARRLGSPLDSAIRITDGAGRQIAFNDDFQDKAAGLLTHQADSWLMVNLPADGSYCVHVYDVQRKAGPEYAYRLRLSGPRPDFELRVVPSAINIRAGETVPVQVQVIRREGFDGDVCLSLKDAPAGFGLKGGLIPPGQEQVRMTLSASRQVEVGLLTLNIEGRAMIGGREVVRPAVPADDRMQAFAYHHLVPADQLDVCVLERPFPGIGGRILSQTPIRIPAGGESVVEIAPPGGRLVRDVRIELSDPPDGIRVARTETTGRGVRLVLRGDAQKVQPGLQGNLVFDVFGQRPAAQTRKAGNRRLSLGSLPAVPFIVVDRP